MLSENYFNMNRNLQLQTVVLVGSGNVAGHLAKAMADAGLRIVQVFSPHIGHARALASEIGAEAVNIYSQIVAEADFYLISVPDAKIAAVAAEMPQVDGIVCHTSGVTSINVLEKFRYSGVFYPFQTFSKNSPVDISHVPFCLEASSSHVMDRLKVLAGKLSKSIYAMDVAQRKKLHLAGVAFDMQELYLMPFLLMLLFLGIFAVTAVGGRAWCGWACPQTIFRVIYRDGIETKLLGLHKRIKNKQKKPAADKSTAGKSTAKK